MWFNQFSNVGNSCTGQLHTVCWSKIVCLNWNKEAVSGPQCKSCISKCNNKNEKCMLLFILISLWQWDLDLRNSYASVVHRLLCWKQIRTAKKLFFIYAIFYRCPRFLNMHTSHFLFSSHVTFEITKRPTCTNFLRHSQTIIHGNFVFEVIGFED